MKQRKVMKLVCQFIFSLKCVSLMNQTHVPWVSFFKWAFFKGRITLFLLPVLQGITYIFQSFISILIFQNLYNYLKLITDSLSCTTSHSLDLPKNNNSPTNLWSWQYRQLTIKLTTLQKFSQIGRCLHFYKKLL